MFQLLSALGVLSLSATLGSAPALALGEQPRQEFRSGSDAVMVEPSRMVPGGAFDRSQMLASRDRDNDRDDDRDDDRDEDDRDCNGDRPSRRNQGNDRSQAQNGSTPFAQDSASRDDDCD